MHKQDLEASLAGLSRDEIAKILSDLAAADPAIEKRIMTAVESPQHPASSKDPATRHSFLDRFSKGLGWKGWTEATPAKLTPKSEHTASDVQVCDNCHKLFRISMVSQKRVGCWGHPGKLEDLQSLVQDGTRLEQAKQAYAATEYGMERFSYKCWTCCLVPKAGVASA